MLITDTGNLLTLDIRIAELIFNYQWRNNTAICMLRPPGNPGLEAWPHEGRKGWEATCCWKYVPKSSTTDSGKLIARMEELGHYPVICGPTDLGINWRAAFLAHGTYASPDWANSASSGVTLEIALARAALLTRGVKFIVQGDA